MASKPRGSLLEEGEFESIGGKKGDDSKGPSNGPKVGKIALLAIVLLAVVGVYGWQYFDIGGSGGGAEKIDEPTEEELRVMEEREKDLEEQRERIIRETGRDPLGGS